MARYGLDYAALRSVESAARLLQRHGFRPDRSISRARRLRLCNPGHGWAHERHRASATTSAAVRRRSASPWPTCSPACTRASPSWPRCGTPSTPVKASTIDMALLDTQVAMLANLGANYLVSGKVPGDARATRTRTSSLTRCSRWRRGRRAQGPSHPGRRQRRPVREILRSRRPSRTGHRRALRKNQDRVRNRARPGAACSRRIMTRRGKADGWPRWRRPRFLAARSTTWPRCSPTRRCASAAW